MAKLAFLADHWAYNDKELNRLLEIVFEWREEKKGEREALLIGGGIFLSTHSPIIYMGQATRETEGNEVT